MQRAVYALTAILLLATSAQLRAQYNKNDESFNRYFVGSTLAMLGNLLPDEKPHFAQLNFGYRLTGKDVVSLEVKTWRYHKPLGIPYGDSFNAAQEKFPGHITESGFALVYQRFLWRGLYTGVHVMSAWQTFVDSDGKDIDNGFQIFNTYRLGYHFKLFGDRFFFEPSFAVTHRPYHTDMPESFARLDRKWGKVFVGEPGLHIGMNL